MDIALMQYDSIYRFLLQNGEHQRSFESHFTYWWTVHCFPSCSYGRLGILPRGCSRSCEYESSVAVLQVAMVGFLLLQSPLRYDYVLQAAAFVQDYGGRLCISPGSGKWEWGRCQRYAVFCHAVIPISTGGIGRISESPTLNLSLSNIW